MPRVDTKHTRPAFDYIEVYEVPRGNCNLTQHTINTINTINNTGISNRSSITINSSINITGITYIAILLYSVHCIIYHYTANQCDGAKYDGLYMCVCMCVYIVYI